MEVDCTNEKIIKEELGETRERGYKTKHKFFLENGKLHILVGNKVRVYDPRYSN